MATIVFRFWYSNSECLLVLEVVKERKCSYKPTSTIQCKENLTGIRIVSCSFTSIKLTIEFHTNFVKTKNRNPMSWNGYFDKREIKHRKMQWSVKNIGFGERVQTGQIKWFQWNHPVLSNIHSKLLSIIRHLRINNLVR